MPPNLAVSRFRTHIPEDLGFRAVRAINAAEAGAEDASWVSTFRPLLGLKVCLGDGRWWDDEAASWRDGAGGLVCIEVGAADVLGEIRTTRVVLATGHRNHDTADNSPANLAAWCQRCHILHDGAEHRRRR